MVLLSAQGMPVARIAEALPDAALERYAIPAVQGGPACRKAAGDPLSGWRAKRKGGKTCCSRRRVSTMSAETEDAHLIREVTERLVMAHPHLGSALVRRSVLTAFSELRYARVTYLPVLMERRATDRLPNVVTRD
ncbi:three-helix bundle dimerization domain-containing protein [Streptomyces sp. NPDC019443]|uniref:three-helix bundle dimerization domain-containing protein n=1 Tax=Streptomyces sp. NPDC019443 TaxID=3365061 RepID=UPI0037A5A6E2